MQSSVSISEIISSLEQQIPLQLVKWVLASASNTIYCAEYIVCTVDNIQAFEISKVQKYVSSKCPSVRVASHNFLFKNFAGLKGAEIIAICDKDREEFFAAKPMYLVANSELNAILALATKVDELTAQLATLNANVLSVLQSNIKTNSPTPNSDSPVRKMPSHVRESTSQASTTVSAPEDMHQDDDSEEV